MTSQRSAAVLASCAGFVKSVRFQSPPITSDVRCCQKPMQPHFILASGMGAASCHTRTGSRAFKPTTELSAERPLAGSAISLQVQVVLVALCGDQVCPSTCSAARSFLLFRLNSSNCFFRICIKGERSKGAGLAWLTCLARSPCLNARNLRLAQGPGLTSVQTALQATSHLPESLSSRAAFKRMRVCQVLAKGSCAPAPAVTSIS